MKYIALLSVLFLSCNRVKSTEDTGGDPKNPVDKRELEGAWTAGGEDSTGVAIVAEGYYSVTWFDLEGRRFLYTLGGSWQLDSNVLVETYEFNTLDSTKVGKTDRFEIDLAGDRLTFTGSGQSWERVDDGNPGALAGAWLITGRQRNGEMGRRVPGARKTMKILSGTRFQWIAYNTETAGFFGTGGGTYTTADTVYTERIEFFSRNADRVGAVLEFQYRLDSGEWHHKGLSSSGTPIYEIWTPRAMLDGPPE